MGAGHNYFELDDDELNAPFESETATHADTDLFAHYTSIDALSAILESAEFRFFSAPDLNDLGEFSFGAEAVIEFIENRSASIQELFGHRWSDIKEAIKRQLGSVRASVFISCLSRHPCADTQMNGRLPMWKSYGGERAIAILLDPYFLGLDSRSKGVFTFPVKYVPPADRLAELAKLEQRVAEYLDLGPSFRMSYEYAQPTEAHERQFIRTMLAYCYYLKHHSFAYEEEWRMVHDAQFFPVTDSTAFYPVRGLPKKCFALALDEKRDGDAGVRDSAAMPDHLRIRSLVRRVLIGPSKHQDETADMAKASLRRYFSDAECEELVVKSQIPLRV